MPSFSERSLRKLADCHPDLQRLFHEVIRHRDCSIVTGFRSREEQEAAFEQGLSKVHWPDGNHNQFPSHAVDVAPWPIDWKNTERNYYFAGFVMGIATMLGIRIRAGADWDSDGNPRNQSLHDPGHFEVVNANQVRPQEEV
jgi:peptidoglycan L-alanyl-D-glutamate endopeptidase CwlK